MDNEHDNIAAADDPPTQLPQTVERLPWEQAIVPVEPDEHDEIEEVGEDGDDEGESGEGHVNGRELVEAEDEEASALSDELREMRIAADEEMAALGKPPFDFEAFTLALREARADGLALAEEDQAAFVSYFDAQIEAGATPAEIGRSVGWYLRQDSINRCTRCIGPTTAGYESLGQFCGGTGNRRTRSRCSSGWGAADWNRS
jgi:hypothetical protein